MLRSRCALLVAFLKSCAHDELCTPPIDSTMIATPPKKPSDFFNVSWLLDTRKDAIKNHLFTCMYEYVLVCRGLSTDDVGAARRGTVFQEVGKAGTWFKNLAISLQESWGAAISRNSFREEWTCNPICSVYPTAEVSKQNMLTTRMNE